MKRSGQILILIALFLVCHLSMAQDIKVNRIKRCPVKTINFETGLLNNGTTGIITDRLGFTWVSTKTGLQRYNGFSLQTITPVAGKDTFRIKYPVYFFELKDGTIWISFRQTVLQYDPYTDRFSVVITLQSEGVSPYNIVPLKEIENTIWCMQENRGIVIYNKQGKFLRQVTSVNPTMIDEVLNSADLLYLNKITTNNNYIFINKNFPANYASTNKNAGIILAINIANSESREINMPEQNILGLTCSEDKLYVLSNNNLYSISIANSRVTRTTSLNKMVTKSFASGNICLKGDNLLLVALNTRLYEFDTAGVCLFELTNLNRNPVLATGFIHQVYPDKFKRIWLVTNNDIKRIEYLEIPFNHFIYPDEKNNFIRTLYYDNKENFLLAGCFYSGIQLYDTMANALWKVPFSIPEVKNIIGIEKLNGSEYLIITFENGWWLFNIAAKTLKPLKVEAETGFLTQTKKVNFPNNIQRISDSILLVANANNVYRCKFSGNKLRSATPLLPDRKFNNAVACLLFDSQHNLWVGTGTGILFKVDKNGNQQSFTIPYLYPVRCIAEDAKNNIWVGTEKGLYVYSQTGHLLKSITSDSELRNDCIYAILPADKTAAVFASSNLGISEISLDGTIKNFSKEMGLQDNEFNTGSALKTSKGKFYFGGINGVTAFYPGSLSTISDTPFVYITKLIVNDSLYNSSAGTWKNDTILLNYNQNRLRFDFAAIGLLNTNEYVYQYRMKGFEEHWQTTYQPTGINYTLGPGGYDLEIICKPILSSEISFSKKFVIIVRPPWWQTFWFRISASLLLIGIIAFIVLQYNRRKYIKKIRDIQTQYELQQERERISRDLHDNIGVQANALLYGTEQLQNLQPGEASLVNNLQSTARDMLQSLRETVWAMKGSNMNASEIWVRIISFCNQLNLFYKETQINVEGEAPENVVLHSAKTLHIVLIIQEAINNSVRHAKAKKITVTSNKESRDGWKISIEDDGFGFDKKSDAKATGGGFGLANMRERAKMAKIDLAVISQSERGTSVIIFIPFTENKN